MGLSATVEMVHCARVCGFAEPSDPHPGGQSVPWGPQMQSAPGSLPSTGRKDLEDWCSQQEIKVSWYHGQTLYMVGVTIAQF